MLKKLLRAAALAAAVLASVPALAEHEGPVRIRVFYGDLDLSKQAGVETLDRRLARAVANVCPSDNGVTELLRKRVISVCRAAKHAEIAPMRQAALAAAQRNGSATFATAQ